MITKQNKLVFIWILFICLNVIAMVLIGGVTRLTGSGLSMVEWKPLMGAIPPLSHQDWVEVFAKYQNSPQYKLVNQGMNLSDFQWIFFWEYFHRLVGRLLGVLFLVPWIFFWKKGYINKNWALRLFVGFLLGGLQGLMGWVMVKSGLVDRPEVSPYRLAAHLLLALFILGYFWRMAWLFYTESLANPAMISKFSKGESKKKNSTADFSTTEVSVEKKIVLFKKALNVLFVLLIAQIFYGALMAGLHAGLMYNTFPDMEGQFFPNGALQFNPFWKNIFENPLFVQWIHRLLGWSLFLGVLSIYINFKEQIPHNVKRVLIILVSVVSLQFFLGVFTLITHVKLAIAVTHQVGASVVLLLLLWLRWKVHHILTSQSL